MAESVTIARPYAEALFRVAKESGQLAQWAERLALLSQLAANPEARATQMSLRRNWLTCFGLPAVRR
jgi:F0F1-type ATP synthase delta subunit